MNQDNYQPCRFYENKGTTDANGAIQFSDGGAFYFAILDSNGKVLLKSESYPTEAARDNGLESVLKNRVNEDFYSVKQEGGDYYLSLRAANHKEIARSCGYKSEAAAKADWVYLAGIQKRALLTKTDDTLPAAAAATLAAVAPKPEPIVPKVEPPVTPEPVLPKPEPVSAYNTTSKIDEPVTPVRPTEYVSETTEAAAGGMKWLWPLLLLIGLGLLAWWLFGKRGNEATPAGTVADTTSAIMDTATVITTTTRTLTKIKLDNGKEIDAYPGGVEDQLIQYIKSGEYKTATEEQLKSKWFNFDDLTFEFNSTKLTPASQRQLDNIKSILSEYPDVKVKLGAYTDKKGDEKANLKLSQDRANAVKAALNSTQVLAAEGYGEQFAVVDENASDAEREKDRKTAIRLAK